MTAALETDLSVGPSSITSYSRLSYTMWHALAEFIDNSTQSRTNYGGVIDEVLKAEGRPLIVEITHSRTAKEIRISDNSIGMDRDGLVAALKIAQPTKDSVGRSKYGMGLKTAACWIGNKWKIITTQWGSGEQWTAEVDVEAIAKQGAKVPLSVDHTVSKDDHKTVIVISDLNRQIRTKTEDTIKSYLGSMYRFDLQSGALQILFNGTPISLPDNYEMDTDPDGKLMRQDFVTPISGKSVKGWFGILAKGKGGRKFGGFSLFQNQRQIQGFPMAWKPKAIFGGVDDEGANNLIAQRLTGVIELDGFEVSHTKDQVLFTAEEEEELEKYLVEHTKAYREYALTRRSNRGQGWSREKFKEMMATLTKEFVSGEFKDGLTSVVLPPLDTILANNANQVTTLTPAEQLGTLDLFKDLKVIVSEQERSEYEPYVTIVAGAEAGVVHVIVNGLHPYYASIESADAVEECFRQFLYDAIAEYRVSKQFGRVNPDSVRRLKNELLKTKSDLIENLAATARDDVALSSE